MYRTGWNDTHRFSLFPVTHQSRPRSPPSFYSSTSEPSLFSFGCAIPFSKKTPLVPSDSPLCSCGGLQPVSLLPFSLISRPERRRGPRYVWHVFMSASLCVPAAVRTSGSADRPFFSTSTQAGSSSLPVSPFPPGFQPKHPIRYRRMDRPVFISNPVRLVSPRLFPNRFPLKSPSFSDAKLVCSRERPAGLDQWHIVQIFLYRASRFGTKFPK